MAVTLRSNADLAKTEKIINEELEKARTKPMTDREFKRAVLQFQSSFIWQLESLMARAQQLQSYNHFVGDPGYISKDIDRWRNSTPEKAMQAAAKYLHPVNRVEALTVPAKGGN